jgi:hypothetical protein
MIDHGRVHLGSDRSVSGSRAPLMRQGLRVEGATIAWNCIEAGVPVVSGIVAASVALTGFGVDSAIEVVSAGLVLRRLRAALVGGGLTMIASVERFDSSPGASWRSPPTSSQTTWPRS